MTSFMDAKTNDRYNKIQKRMEFLRAQIVHGDKLDGWSLQGHKDELEILEKELKNIINNDTKEI